MGNLRHVGIVVTETEKSIKFFKDVLDMEILIDQIETGDFIDELIGIKETIVRTVKLRDKSNGVLELLEFHNPKANEKLNLVKPNSYGITHIAITVESADEIFRKIRNLDYETVGKPKISHDSRVKAFYTRGPENILLEIVEVL